MTDPIAAARQMADAYDRESVITARISQAFATFAARLEEEASQPDDAEPDAQQEDAQPDEEAAS